jgi:hypothetical protein
MSVTARFRITALILFNALGLTVGESTAMAYADGLDQRPETAAYRELVASTNLLSGDVDPEQMVIDILPGNADNVVDLKKVRIIVVAIMGSATLDITDINPRTISLEAETQTLVGKTDKSLCETADINNDGFDDLVCKLKTIGFRVETGEIPVLISAGTYQRESLRARGVLRYVPSK